MEKFTAKEARANAEDLNRVELNQVLETIKSYSDSGCFFCYFYDIKKNTMTELENLGYKIEHLNHLNYSVSW